MVQNTQTPALRKGGKMASLFYTVSSKLARTTSGDPVSKTDRQIHQAQYLPISTCVERPQDELLEQKKDSRSSRPDHSLPVGMLSSLPSCSANVETIQAVVKL